MEFDSDTLYILATGISILLILAVVIVKYFFNKGEDKVFLHKDKGEINEGMNPVDGALVKGRFGELPVSRWKESKLALDETVHDTTIQQSRLNQMRSMYAGMLFQQYKNLLGDQSNKSAEDSDDGDGTSQLKGAKASSGKVVRFEDVDDDQEQKMEDDDDDGDDDGEELVEGIVNGETLDEATLEHLPAQLKSAKLRKVTKELEKELTDEQKEEETKIRSQQLESIFNLMREQQDKFGVASMEDIEEQLKLYSF